MRRLIAVAILCSAWTVDATAHAAARARIDTAAGFRYITSVGLPDHATGSFPSRGNPHRISAQRYEFRAPAEPRASGGVTPLTGAIPADQTVV